jgi:hypothetical protein
MYHSGPWRQPFLKIVTKTAAHSGEGGGGVKHQLEFCLSLYIELWHHVIYADVSAPLIRSADR